MHVELRGANQALLQNKETHKLLVKKIGEIYDRMQTRAERVLIHCAAGVHRTGTVAYTLLRMSGMGPEEAYKALG